MLVKLRRKTSEMSTGKISSDLSRDLKLTKNSENFSQRKVVMTDITVRGRGRSRGTQEENRIWEKEQNGKLDATKDNLKIRLFDQKRLDEAIEHFHTKNDDISNRVITPKEAVQLGHYITKMLKKIHGILGKRSQLLIRTRAPRFMNKKAAEAKIRNILLSALNPLKAWVTDECSKISTTGVYDRDSIHQFRLIFNSTEEKLLRLKLYRLEECLM